MEDDSKQIGEAVLHQGVEENEEIESLKDTREKEGDIGSLRDEIEKEGDDILESNVQPCNANGTETKESDEGSGHTQKSQTDSGKVDEPIGASSEDAHLVGGPVTISSEDAHLVGEPVTVLSRDAYMVGPALSEHRLSEIEKGIMLNPDPNIEKAAVT